jgi:hypothetical protein
MIELKITIDDRGQVSVSGPVDNVHMCYGLLEIARDIVYDRQQQNKQTVVPPTGDDVRRLSLNR